MKYQDLIVIDELRVGPVTLTSRRVETPYTILQNGARHQNDLIFSYPENVFRSESAADQNLAALLTAQVALNYGLFCRRIVFDGRFDEEDKRLLREMMENTSREIYVNKLLQPNPFLVGAILDLKPERRRRYNNAEVVFVDTQHEPTHGAWDYWPTDSARYCVLSSGGKDSLLSYALLKELGLEAHAVFGNESGRHWFTSLNGYRYLKETDKNTTKVWMNSDRLFAWMLRHLPFVREDFAQLRADDYPIRLWTVAVFIFGALPFMKKRGLGRLVIGNEYDTTMRSQYEGITNYQGLFDQSRYFDELMSRFFLKKGWAVHQFSIIRPLSELLIEKVLAERYPQLQIHQVSCHATHEEKGRIRPCGKCEKCRRIVGMLTALDIDPRRCGYTEEQIDAALQALASTTVRQLDTDAAHLFYLLEQRGKLPAAPHPKITPGAFPEIMQLRFDRERSRIDTIPNDLRGRLFSILLQYAGGSVQWGNRRWTPFDLLQSAALHWPGPFEFPETLPEFPAAGTPEEGPLEWGHLTWEEARDRLQKTDIALLPVGAIEQHGPHLPLDVDAFDANYLAHKVAQL